ncbi:uncharacterized protein LOC131213226 [Anopheles bellator]|uniref:uncharacterized protein LOC131213226 n=1 Tax=Anopheles bellator TaxID=139047 RepID=UPI002649A8FF|nr:uncharacterized protein LOC131213226 [Anopheles bellator]
MSSAHGEKWCLRAAPVLTAHQEKCITFCGGLGKRSTRSTLAAAPVQQPTTHDVLLLQEFHEESPEAVTSSGLSKPPEPLATSWMNTVNTHAITPVSNSELLDAGSPSEWWRYVSMFTEDATVDLLAAKSMPMAIIDGSNATTGEQVTLIARETAEVCRNKFEKQGMSSSSSAEISVSVHDNVCNKTISSSGDTRNSSGMLSIGDRIPSTGHGCNSIGTVAKLAVTMTEAESTATDESFKPEHPSQRHLKNISCNSSNIGTSANCISNTLSGEPFNANINNKDDTALLIPILSDLDWTNETRLSNAFFSNSTADHLWISSPINTNHHINHNSTEKHVMSGVCSPIDVNRHGFVEPNGSPISLHEEIEQLSSAFDYDASNHFVSGLPLTATNNTATSLDPIVPGPPETEMTSLNIFKWLQEDIFPPMDRQLNVMEGSSFPNGVVSFCREPLSILESTSTLVEAAAETTTHCKGKDEEQLQDTAFEHSLDQAQNIIHISHFIDDGTQRLDVESPAMIKNHSQCDHNYSTIKRCRETQFDDSTIVGPSIAKMSRPQSATDSLIVMPFDDCRSDNCSLTLHNKISTNQQMALSEKSEESITIATCINTTTPTETDAATATKTVLGTASILSPNRVKPCGKHNATLKGNVTAVVPKQPSINHNLSLQLCGVTGNTPIALNTPDLTNDILDLEDEKFDLLSFIDPTTNENSLQLNTCNLAAGERETIIEKKANVRPLSVFQQLQLPATSSGRSTSDIIMSNKKQGAMKTPIFQLLTIESLSQLTSSIVDDNSLPNVHDDTLNGSLSSASSTYGDSSSDVSFSTKPTKRRGRPPKTTGAVRDRTEYQHLSEADWRYREQRDKNNEASRKSRINRKDREIKLEQEADELNVQHQKLSHDERRLQKECKQWRKAVMKLALL